MASGRATTSGAATISRVALLIGLASLASFITLSAVIERLPVPEWERDVVHYVVDLPAWSMRIPRILMHLSTRFTVPILALAAYLVTLRWRTAATVTVACVVGALPVFVAKHWVSRPRPDDIPVRDDFYGSGYASGHLTIAVAAAVAVAPYLLAMPRERRERRQATNPTDPGLLRPDYQRWLLAAVPFVLAVGVGIGRLYVGAHYPLDLVGGALAGVAGGMLVLALPHFQPATESSIALLPEAAQRLAYHSGDVLGSTPGVRRMVPHLAPGQPRQQRRSRSRM